MLSVLLWVIFGLVVGVTAKLLMPGRDPGGFVATALLGIAGSLVGGFIGQAIGLYPSYRDAGSYVMAILGAMIVLGVYNVTVGRRGRI